MVSNHKDFIKYWDGGEGETENKEIKRWTISVCACVCVFSGYYTSSLMQPFNIH